MTLPTDPPRIWTGVTWHDRRAPREHHFTYRMWWADLDLDSVEATVGSLRLLSGRRGTPLQFRRSDYLGDPDQPLVESVRDLVERRTGERPMGPIRLLAHLRTAGWCFNPITLYLVHDTSGRLQRVVASVTNTPWKETHEYLLAVRDGRVEGHVEPKRLHVSPFMPMHQSYRFDLAVDEERLSLRITTVEDGAEPFSAGVDLRARPMTDLTLAVAAATHPLLTMRVSLGIHRQALRLWRAGVPVHRHPRHDRQPTEVRG